MLIQESWGELRESTLGLAFSPLSQINPPTHTQEKKMKSNRTYWPYDNHWKALGFL